MEIGKMDVRNQYLQFFSTFVASNIFYMVQKIQGTYH